MVKIVIGILYYQLWNEHEHRIIMRDVKLYNFIKLTLEHTEGAITIGQSIETGNKGTQDEDKQGKNTACVGHHHNTQANTNNVK